MKRIRFIVEQIEESKRPIKHADVSYLRMAYVLLDNAVEILMHRTVTQELIYNELYRQMKESATRGLKTEQLKKFETEVTLPSVIDLKRERLIKKYFGEKTRYLSEDKSYFSKSTASILRSLHKYRNELYHNDIIREETIRASVILLYEVVCDLLKILPPSSYSISSAEDYESHGWKRFFAEYKIKKPYILEDRIWLRISRQLKEDMVINIGDLRDVLKMHLLTRIDDAIHNIEFVMQDGLGIRDIERALKHIQYLESGNIIGLKDPDELLRRYKAKYSMKIFDKWRNKIERLDKIGSKIKLFEAYSEVENEVEPLEKQISHAAMELDSAMQHAIDIARGK